MTIFILLLKEMAIILFQEMKKNMSGKKSVSARKEKSKKREGWFMSLKSLNKTQKAAVEAIDGPVLIFAGAEW